MSEHKFILEPYSVNARYKCPICQAKGKTFTRYIDTATGQYLSPLVGRCDREIKCGYHYKPRDYFQANKILFSKDWKSIPNGKLIAPTCNLTSFIPVGVFKGSLKAYSSNNFVSYLSSLFEEKTTDQLVSRYFIGTSKYWPGATVFWQIDTNGKIRTGKIMLYSPYTGKRVREPYNHINWVHKVLKQPEFELRQCFFGEHLLSDNTKPVAIVESEKTAVIASAYLPQFTWLATGSISNLSADKCRILKGLDVTLFPDVDAYHTWLQKAKELSNLAKFQVSDLLERKATEYERELGLDLADYLIKYVQFDSSN